MAYILIVDIQPQFRPQLVRMIESAGQRPGLSLQAKVLDLKGRVRCRGCGARGRAVVSINWGR